MSFCAFIHRPLAIGQVLQSKPAQLQLVPLSSLSDAPISGCFAWIFVPIEEQLLRALKASFHKEMYIYVVQKLKLGN